MAFGRWLVLGGIALALPLAAAAAAPKTERVVKVGYFEYRPGIFRAPGGQVEGFYPELLRAVAAEEGWRLEYVFGSWNDGLDRVRSGEVDLLTSVAFTEERATYLDYCHQPLLTVWGELYLPADSPARSIVEVRGLTVAVMRGDFNGLSFRRLADQLGLECRFVECSDFAEVFATVQAGRAEAAVVNSVFGRAMHEAYGLRPTGTVFSPFDIFFAVAKGKNPEVREALDRALERWRSDAKSPYYEARERWLHAGAGEVRVVPKWVGRFIGGAVLVLAVAGGFIVLLRSQVRRQTEGLRAERERFRVLVENIHDLVIEVGGDGRVRYVNRLQSRTLGYAPSALLGRELAEFLHPDDRTRWAALAGPDSDDLGRLRLRAADGEWRTMECAASPLGEGGTRIVTARDVTERLKIEAVRDGLESQLRQAQKLEAIGTLAGGIAHDFNNVLTGIVGNAEVIALELPPGHGLDEPIEAIRQAGARARDLVARILTFSRRSEPRRRFCPVTPIIRETIQLLRAAMPAEISIRADLPAAGANVLCDSSQIHQVLMNLCTNAMYSMRRDGGVLSLAETEVIVDAGLVAQQPRLKPGNYVRITVQDTGCGMSPGVQSRLFEPFFTTKPPGEGTGLGLSVVHGIVATHEGAITLASHEGEGTTFQIYLPVAVQPERQLEVAAPADLPRGGGQRILVVDDEEVIRTMLDRVLTRLGYRPECCASVEEGWGRLAAAPQEYSLVLSDLSMPAANGLELAARLRTLKAPPPLVLMSGYVGPVEADRARELGVAAILDKPPELAALARLLRRVLEKGRTAG